MISSIEGALVELRRQRDEFNIAIKTLEWLLPSCAKAEPAPMPTKPTIATKPTMPTVPKGKPGRPSGRDGSVLGFVSAAVARRSKPYTVRELVEEVSKKAGKDVLASGVRAALGILVNTGEAEIVREGTSPTNPTTYATTARGRKGEAGE